MTRNAKDVLIQNLRLMTIMKSVGRTDREICEAIGIEVKDFLEILDNDDYLREKYERAQDKVVTEVEEKFLLSVLLKLEDGETTDAKWLLERTSGKYQKNEKLEVTVRSIDDIIRERED
jgi:hypothetical protein